MGKQSRIKKERQVQREQERARLDLQVETRRAEAEALFDEFERTLASQGIKIPPDSKLEQAMLLARHIKYIREENAALPVLTPDEEDDMFRRTTWLWGMAPKVIAAARHEDFRELVPHLKLVVDGEFAQSVPGDPNEDSDKLFELVIALAVLPFAKNLKVDTGNAADRNPDLLFDFGGQRWGIACKALYTGKPERYRDSVIKGASQIEKSEAERGVVCVSLRNLLDQSLFLPRHGDALVGMPKHAMREVLEQEETRITREVVTPVKADIGRDFESRPKTEKAVIHVSAGCARTGTPDDIRMTYFAHVMTVGTVHDALEEALNAGLQAIQPPLP